MNVSSIGHWGVLTEDKGGPVVWDSLSGEGRRKGMNTGALWDQSKGVSIHHPND